MALAVCIGFVVDDAIVMIENMFRNMEKGYSPLRAAFAGARQIGFTVVSISVSLIAAFIPLLFMGGVVGRLFREFSVTLCFAIAISTVVSLSVTPMICAHFVKEAPTPERDLARPRVEGALSRMVRFYDRTLGFVLRTPHAGAARLRRDHRAHRRALHQDAEGLFPAGRHRTDLRRHAGLDRHLLRGDAGIAAAGDGHRAGRSGGGRRRLLGRQRRPGRRLGQSRPAVHQPEAARRARQLPTQAVIDRLRAQLRNIAGMRVFMFPAQDLRVGGRQSDSSLSVHAVESGHRRAAILGAEGGGSRQDAARPHRRHHRPRAGRPAGQYRRSTGRRRRGSACASRTSTTRSTTPSRSGRFRRSTRSATSTASSWRSISSSSATRPTSPSSTCRATAARRCRCRRWRSVERGIAPLVVNHQGQFPAVTITYNLAPGVADRGSHRGARRRRSPRLHLPDTLHAEFAGDAKAFQQAVSAQPLLILAALLAVYIVLGVLYESLAHPLTIISTLPSAGLGALLALQVVRHRADGDRLHRHHSADRHRQEERHHDGRLRARRRTRGAACRRRRPSTRPAWSASGRS